jgi:phosphatidylserine decarboxylase
MKRDENSIIAKEGKGIIVISTIIAFILYTYISHMLAMVVVAFVLFLMYVYRNPERYIYDYHNEIVAPIDGKVVGIDKKGLATKIYIDVSIFSPVHIIRSPIDGSYALMQKRGGSNLSHYSFKSKKINEFYNMVFENGDMKCCLKIYPGLCNYGSIKSSNSSHVDKGEKVGVLTHGMIIVSLPNYSKLNVEIGDNVYSSESVIAEVGESCSL